MRRVFVSLFFLFSFLSFLSCSSDFEDRLRDISIGRSNFNIKNKEIKITRSEKKVLCGITPWADPDKMVRIYSPLLEYLSEQLGRRFILIVEEKYSDLITDMASGKVNFGFFSPSAYAKALEEIPDKMVYLLTLTKGGRPYYEGFIFVKASSHYKSIWDLKGKKFGFVDRESSSGYKYPMAMFLKMGIDPERFFSKIYFLGSHPKVTDAVYKGSVDGGATWDANYRDAQKRYGKNAFRIILKTPPIPFDAYVANKTFYEKNKDFVERFVKTMLSINKDTRTKSGKLVLHSDFPYTGAVVKDEKFYYPMLKLRKIIKEYEEKKHG